MRATQTEARPSPKWTRNDAFSIKFINCHYSPFEMAMHNAMALCPSIGRSLHHSFIHSLLHLIWKFDAMPSDAIQCNVIMQCREIKMREKTEFYLQKCRFSLRPFHIDEVSYIFSRLVDGIARKDQNELRRKKKTRRKLEQMKKIKKNGIAEKKKCI